ncbi:MAG: rRNA-binding ribosome biosynthesis protein utp25 [Trizodia sp. TS-e1964]|nr:MAG: rRNA-binding ribosome biosynthesis protein utp25 [Trizodia sp. TS-e1964]
MASEEKEEEEGKEALGDGAEVALEATNAPPSKHLVAKSKLIGKEIDPPPADENASSPEEEEVDEDGSSDEESTATGGYQALMSLINMDSGSSNKRRKIDRTHDKEDSVNATNSLTTETEVDDIGDAEDKEEEGEAEIEPLDGDDKSEDGADDDPFEQHFANPNPDILSERLEAMSKNSYRLQKVKCPIRGNVIMSSPNIKEDLAPPLSRKYAGPKQLKLKPKLMESALAIQGSFDCLSRGLAPIIFNYQDLLYCDRTPDNAQSLRFLYCLHALNHVFKTRDRVIKNTAKLSKTEEMADDVECRDQGFTRPKVLILLPTRESCVKVADTIVSLCNPEQQENRKRFMDSFHEEEITPSSDKPPDFNELFDGNSDDMFRIGLKFTRKTIKYFSQFYTSDIILASPLGLQLAIGTDDTKPIDADFLSSIELLIVDQCDALHQQNWEHIESIFTHLNQQPKAAHGCDFSRVRTWSLDGHAKHLRQTLLFTAFPFPELNALASTTSNVSGRVKCTPDYAGVLTSTSSTRTPQLFTRYVSPSQASDPDARFAFFTAATLPSLLRHSSALRGILIFVSSSLDFPRVRNYFASAAPTKHVSFGVIDEYAAPRAVARARSHFASGRHAVLLYTERAHHFRRLRIRGVRTVVWYALPQNPLFYRELGACVGLGVEEGTVGGVRALFSRYDKLRLERVVGGERARGMVEGEMDTFKFL